jgi:probable HAF family extracellular repeat protein
MFHLPIYRTLTGVNGMTSITSLKTKVTNLTLLLGSAAVMSLGINTRAMAAAMYDLTDLGNLGQPFSFAYDINDKGQVVGYSGDYLIRAFLWKRSTGITDLGTLPETDDSVANGINNAGKVVGSSGNRAFLWNPSTGMSEIPTLSSANAINNAGKVVGSSGNRAFLWNPSTGTTDLGTLPGASSSSATDINDAGQVVGDADNHAFLWGESTGMTDLGTLPDKNSSSAAAINNFGQVVGTSGNSDDSISSRAFLWSDSTGMVNLGTLPSQDPDNPDYTASSALDINDAGQVVGYSVQPYRSNAFLWSNSTGMVDLNTLIDPGLDWQLGAATGINNQGQIIGYSRFGSFDYRAFLLTPKSSQPVPEPMTIGGSIIAGAALLYLRRRQHRLSR